MRALVDYRLYAILDLGYVEIADIPRIARELIEGGVDLLQLRGKEQSIEELRALAAKIHAITSPREVPLFINDHAVIAQTVPLEGVHVGQDDLPVSEVRRISGRPILVGKSTHDLVQAKAAQTEGADYIGFGPLFATPTKPAYRPIGLDDIKQVHEEIDVPIFCIGGIKLSNLAEVLTAGAGKVVMVSGLLQSQDLAATTRAAKQLLSTLAPAEVKAEI